MVNFNKALPDALTREVVILRFKITQHSRDEQLMKSLIDFFEAGNVYKFNEVIDFKISKFKDLVDKVIPFFEEYPIIGVKALDFADWCKVADLIKKQAHLTREGVEEIRKIKSGMNRGREKLIL